MGTGTETDSTEGLEYDIQQAEELADEFIGPDHEDFDEGILNETVEQTLERTKAAVKSGKEPDATEDKSDGGSGKKAAEAKEPASADDQAAGPIELPQRASAEFRSWVASQPPEAQAAINREVSKMVGDLENGQRQKLREIHDYRQAVEPVFQALSPWQKDWAGRGITLPQGVALLAQTHERMVANPAKELARLISDNNVSIEQVEAHLNGTADQASNGNGNGYQMDISQHPEFRSLREQVEQFNLEREEARVKTETDKVRALRDEVDANGNRPFEHILDSGFLQYAQPLVTALRTPPRGPDGKFTGGPAMNLVDAYKKAYRVWASEQGPSPQSQPTSHQPFNSQPQQTRKPAQPISMRPRSAPIGKVVSSNDDPATYLNESVEDTLRRSIAQATRG